MSTPLTIKVDSEYVFSEIVDLLQLLVTAYNSEEAAPLYVKTPCFEYLTERNENEMVDYRYSKFETREELLQTIIVSAPVGVTIQ